MFRSTLLSAVAVAFFVVAPSGPASASEAIEGFIAQQVDPLVAPDAAPAAPALVAIVVVGGEVTVVARGALADGLPPDIDTAFRVASVTKVLTGLLVAANVHGGAFAYDDPVGPCSEGETSGLCFEGVSVSWLDLLTHRAGLPTVPTNLEGEPGDYDGAQLDAFFDGYDLERAPGTEFDYSTTGYAAIGRLLERRGGGAFDDQLEAVVLRPLGLVSTKLEPPGAARVATGHRDGAKVEDPARAPALSPSGSYWSSAGDLARLLGAELDPDSAGPLAPALLLTQETLPERPTFQGSVSARGWQYFEPLAAYWHAGSAPGHSAFVAFSRPSGVGVVLLVNTALPHTDPRLAKVGFTLLGGVAAMTATEPETP